MSALSAAASDEDGDTINTLRAENEMLRQSLLAMHNTLEMTAKAGAHHARAAACLRETVIRWASRAEQAEDMLEAIGAGGVGRVEPSPAVKQSLTDEQPQVEQEPVAWAVMQNGEICWDADYPFSNKPGWSYSDQECVPLYTHPQPPVVKQSATVSASAYDRLQTLCDSQAARIIELEQPRQPLTPETVNDLWHKYGRSGAYIHAFAQAIERAHGVGGDA